MSLSFDGASLADVLRSFLQNFKEPEEITVVELAYEAGISTDIVNGLLQGTLDLTPDIAERLATFFQMSAEVWLRLTWQTSTYTALHS